MLPALLWRVTLSLGIATHVPVVTHTLPGTFPTARAVGTSGTSDVGPQRTGVADSLVFHARNGQTDVPMTGPLDGQVVIDGLLNEPVWLSARRLTGFSMYTPVDARPAPDSTEVLVWYSSNALHFGVRGFEPHGAVRATPAERDRVNNDDNIELQLDTFEERRRAFVFIVNPLTPSLRADATARVRAR